MSIFKHRNTLLFILACLISLDVSLLVDRSYSRYLSTIDVDASSGIAKWSILVDGEENTTITIDLNETITDNDYSTEYLVPGSTGAFTIEIDGTDTQVAFDYSISFKNANIPSLIEFYSDEDHENVIYLDEVVGIVYASEDDKVVDLTIYWEWLYLTDDESNELDNEWMDKDITIDAVLTVKQRIEGDN